MSDSTLGVYIHVPFCRHECPYCDFNKMALANADPTLRKDFCTIIAKEFQLALEADPSLRDRSLETIYFGGGTPSLLSPKDVSNLLESIQKVFGKVAKEITLEANPENLVEKRARDWKEAGINRLSVGVQSFLQSDLDRLERLHRLDTIFDAFENIQSAGFENVSLDLMFALPGQKLADWEANLRQALTLPITHISLYGLTYHEHTPFYGKLTSGGLREVDEETQAEMFLLADRLLTEHGFEHYEVSNFAKPGYRSRHNQRYWHRGDVLALGPGAHGNLGTLRWEDEGTLELWAKSVESRLLPRRNVTQSSAYVLDGERLYTKLRLVEGISITEDSDLYKAAIQWASKQDATMRHCYRADDCRFALTPDGWLLSDAIIAQIIEQLSATGSRYSEDQ